MNCELCEKIEKKETIYEDSLCVAFLGNSVKGHIIVAPKEHYAILEQTPNDVIERIFEVSNKASILVFESLKVKGTNIIVNNGVSAGQKVAHCSLSVLPRTENDGIDFNFSRSQADPKKLSEVASTLKDSADFIGTEKKPEPQQEITAEVEKMIEDEDNYMLRQLRRIP